MGIEQELQRCFERDKSGIYTSAGEGGYWSNLDREENIRLLEALQEHPAREALLSEQPQLDNVIYSPKRQAGLELLRLSGNETCIDYGCMWGALTIPLAKRADFVLGIDQTMDSLTFLAARAREEGLSNISLFCVNLRKMPVLENKADIAVVNGVLEWIPEDNDIELKSYYARYARKDYDTSPYEQQSGFLRTVYENLSDGGKLYLAIENRYDFKVLLGAKDPHAGIRLVSFLPRPAANLVSMLRLGRPYRTWLYSFRTLPHLVEQAGFSRVDLHMCFPDYRFPQRIIPYHAALKGFQPTISPTNGDGKKTLRKLLARRIEMTFFNIFRAKYLAPSIIAVAYK